MIRVFDKNLNFIDEVDDYESLIFTRDYYTYGTFEITINPDKKNAKHLTKDNIIFVGKSLVKGGIIKSLEQNQEDSDFLTVSGFTPDYLLGTRVIIPPTSQEFDTITGSIETCIKHYIDVCMINPTDANRKIDIFNLTSDQARGANATFNARGENLSEFVSTIRTVGEVGIESKFNKATKKIDLDVLIGVEKTSSSETKVIFSTDYDNLRSQSFYQNDVDEKNVAFVFGQGDGAAREMIEVGVASGIDRKEIVIEGNVPSEDLEEFGLTELAQYKEVVTFEAEVINRSPFFYEEDFNLGDIVTITNKRLGVQLDSRITQITEIYEPENNTIEVVFGNNIPTLKSVINKKTKKEVR